MDLTQFEWDIVESKRTYLQAMMPRLPFLLPLAGALAYGCYYLAYHQPYFKSSEAFYLLLPNAIVIPLLVNQLNHSIILSIGQRLTHFKISQEGLEISKKKIPLDSLKTTDIDATLEQIARPYPEWRQPRPTDGKPLELILTTTQGKIKILFAEEYVRQKFTRALRGYLHPDKFSIT